MLHPPIKLRYGFNDAYPGTWTTKGVGAQSAPFRRGWYPQIPVTDGRITALCRIKKWLYIGGKFANVMVTTDDAGTTTTAMTPIPNLCRMNLEDGLVDPDWVPAPDDNGFFDSIYCLATDGELLYVGGVFQNMGGVPCTYGAKFKANGVRDVDWICKANAPIKAIATKTGTDHVYLGGPFTALGSDVRATVAEVDRECIATAFNANNPAGVGDCYSLAYDLSQNMLYAGGAWLSFAGRNNAIGGYGANLVKVDGDTGALNAWNPLMSGSVYTITLAYPLLYIGGDFIAIGAATRHALAVVDQAGAATSFVSSTTLDFVRSLSVDFDKNRLYATVADPAIQLIAMDLTGARVSWSPLGAAPGSTIATIVLRFKDTVFSGWSSLYQGNGIGSTLLSESYGASFPFPLFRDDNTIFVKQTGLYKDAGVGTYADPKRTIFGANGTEPTFKDQSAAGNDMAAINVVQFQYDGFVTPAKGYYMAGPFNDTNYLTPPNALGVGIAANNAFTVQMGVYIESLSTISTLWNVKDATGDTILQVNTNGSISFNIQGTTATSATGLIKARQHYKIAIQKNPSGNTKKVWLWQGSGAPALIISTTQTATMGTFTGSFIGKNRTSANVYLNGFVGDIFIFKTAAADALGLPLTWRNSTDTNCIAYYPMQTKSALEGAITNRYVCILDSGVYDEAVKWHVDGTSLYANDGCAPTIQPRIGAKIGTFGARRTGREEFSTGAAGTFIYVAKSGNNSTGTRGDSTKPFLTIQAALGAAGITAGDTVQIQDSGIYSELINAATAVTVQAAAGQVPQLIAPSPNVSTFLQGNMSLIGLFVKASDPLAVGSYGPTASVTLSDCTFINFDFAPNASAGNFVVKNCSLIESAIVPVSTLTLKISNSKISGINVTPGSFEGSPYTVAHQCTFEAANVLQINVSSSITGVYLLASLCQFNTANFGASVDASSGVFACAYMCRFTGLSGQVNFSGTTTPKITVLAATKCLSQNMYAVDCGSSGDLGDTWISFKHCASIGSAAAFSIPGDGIYARAASTGTGHLNIDHCTVLNPAGTAVKIEGANTMPTHYNGSLTNTPTSIAATDGGFSSIDYHGFINEIAGSENVALSTGILTHTFSGNTVVVQSALFTGDAAGNSDQGVNWAWVHNQVNGATFNGLTIAGDINMGAGIENVSGQATALEHMSVSGLGTSGILSRQGMSISACNGERTNGIAFRVGGTSAQVKRSIAWGCAGAGFVYGFTDYNADHNSTWGCEAGHIDAILATGSFADEIHSDNGIDASANSSVNFSDVGGIGASTLIGSGTIRANPLYVDAYDGDLSLKTVELGYAFNSPAKGACADGSDMGAYEAEYGPKHRDFIQLDFATIVSPITGHLWYNPDDIPKHQIPVKLSEGDKPLGGFYSSAKAIKNQWTLNWNPQANPMPADQLEAMEEVYAEQGIVELWMDQGPWIRCQVVKSNNTDSDQVDSAYTDDSVPRPMASLVLREV